MKLQVSKNVQFTRLLKADGRLREFNFRKIYGLQQGLFSVDVVDDRGNRLIFKMQKEETTWQIAGQELPFWVTDSSALLHEKIEEVMHTLNPEETMTVSNE